jgi:hypothetical protein
LEPQAEVASVGRILVEFADKPDFLDRTDNSEFADKPGKRSELFESSLVVDGVLESISTTCLRNAVMSKDPKSEKDRQVIIFFLRFKGFA